MIDSFWPCRKQQRIKLKMRSVKGTDKNERFKIQIVHKNPKRVQSTSLQSNKTVESKIQNYRLSQMNEKRKSISVEEKKSSTSKYAKSWSELTNVRTEVEEQKRSWMLSRSDEKPLINLLNKKQRHSYLKFLQQSEHEKTELQIIVNKKMEENVKVEKKNKNKGNNIFYDLKIMKCQSITLLKEKQSKRANLNMTNLKPSKHMQTSQDKKSAEKRRIKLSNVHEFNKIMTFHLSSHFESDLIYMKKLKSYLDFLFKVNFSNRFFLNFAFDQEASNSKYRVYVANGNNHQIVKYCLKTRFWIDVVDSYHSSDIRFFWTPWPLDQLFHSQRNRHNQISQIPLLYIKKHCKIQDQVINQNQKILIGKQCSKVQNFICSDGYVKPFPQLKSPLFITNHLSNSSCISHKKKLFRSIFQFYQNKLKKDPFSIIPLTYCVSSLQDPEFKRFLRDNQLKANLLWIVKPGEDTNRGQGIDLAYTNDVFKHIQQGLRKTYIIQSYIDRPMLYHGRKFDVRHFLLITSINGLIKAYWFKEGYIRTSSEYFNLTNISDKYIHLTNDAIQKNSKTYNMFEPSNKVSYSEFQRYLDTIYPGKSVNFQENILKKMKQIITNVVIANYTHIDSKLKQANFELFGIDFMIDRELKPWLIQINENPCLQTNCPLLNRLIHSVIENTLRVCLDPLFPPRCHFPGKLRSSLNDHYLASLKYEIIFDELNMGQC